MTERAQPSIGVAANTEEGKSLALGATMFHWGLHPWAMCAIVGLSLVFLVTSSDSGSLVIDGITAGGKEDAPVAQRVFWATMEGVIAATLLFGGGAQALSALQARAVTAGLPFAVILILMCVSLYMGLSGESKRLARAA